LLWQQPKIPRGEIWWVNLDPAQGSEIKKNSHCLVLSHDALNRLQRTVVVVPFSSAAKPHPPLIKVEFVSAIARWTKTEEINEVQAIWVENTFNKDVNAGLYVSRRVMPAHFNQAEKWLSSLKTALRTLDALNIACCWDYEAKLITCDAIMHRSAETVGIDTIFLEL